MFSLLTEWNEAPGVKDPVLAATWARLEIQEDSTGEPKWLTRVIRSATNSVDRGVYGAMFPLAEWIVQNWWFLFHESCRVPELPSGRRLACDPAQRNWVQRHNLLAAREGGALPDLTLFRDGTAMSLQWTPDPDGDDRGRHVRFVEQGAAFADAVDIERALHRFVEAVLDRLHGRTDDSSERLRKNWNAVCDSRQTESALCSWSASLGLDPYDEKELTDDLAELMLTRVAALSAPLRLDLVDAATGASLDSDLGWVEKALRRVSISGEVGTGTHVPTRIAAHQAGYQLAAHVHQHYSLPQGPIPDLAGLLHDRCGWPAPERQTITMESTHSIGALVATGDDEKPRVVGPPLGHWAARFRLARSLYFLAGGSHYASPRLVTHAFTWDQRASRAFAAELLAPAAALRDKIGDVVSADEVDQLARQFDVRPNLVEHQIRNHHLAWIDEE